MLTPATFVLTSAERLVLQHRLDVCDCIAECLEGKFTSEQVAATVQLLEAGRWTDAFASDPECAAAVLEDAVDGSTYYAGAYSAWEDGDISQQQLNAAVRVGNSLARKVSDLIGRTVRFPLH